MDDLVRWLGAQFDEDERIARAAAEELDGFALGGEWRYDGRYVETVRERTMVAVGSQDFMELTVGEFIAAHDPARVLREIDAKRRILALHSFPTGHGCSTTDEAGYNFNYDEVSPTDACTTLRLLATVYSGRPDYREEWAP